MRYFDFSITCTGMTVLSFNVCILQCIGGVGRVIEVDSDGDVQIRVDGDDWIFNPYCVVPARPEEIAGWQSHCRLLFVD